ncbi:hypothetical protein [Paenibacillus xylaniclasticus]|uniref:hypothetical protein n=1 Tax=Paenibacillus xylaniclasticus TaxID=588083 RepID=UPI000FDCB137|nr:MULTISPECIES: hypothetical protein [Paenibacillus]GFN32451.1 hypothetical protein PCURB6_27110 [Paenibacillus curdlanolyticus]
MRVPYTYLEAETISKEYEEQVPLKVITEIINKEFHNGKEIRTVKSIQYVIGRINSDDDWFSKLEDQWLQTISIIAN